MMWNLVVLFVFASTVTAFQSAFNHQLYEDVLDPEQCQQQLTLLVNSSLRYQFYDASFRIPSGLLTGNINDLGDFHQCLSIDQFIEDTRIMGKYCTVLVPLNQDPIDWPNLPEWPDWIPELPDLNITLPNITFPETGNRTRHYSPNLMNLQAWALKLASINSNPESRIFPSLISAMFGMTLAVCVPKVCSPREAINFFQELAPFVNVEFTENYCRLPNDKPLALADYIAIGIFTIIGLLLIFSTTYDLMQTFYYKKKPSEVNQLYRSFSVYTNTRRLLTFNSAPGTVECLDGIRSISMLWVIVGHTYSFTLTAYVHNLLDIFNWMISLSSFWINSAPITVDTFFMLSGILVVYTVIGKLSRGRFIRSIHLFYMNRLLRMFPLLATMVLLQASLINRFADGPFWNNVAAATENCRHWWWAVLLHVQNYVNPLDICLPQSWYLSVDTQLYILAPLVMWWLWGHPCVAWTALCCATLLSLVSSSIYSFMFNFSAALANINRLGEFNDYIKMFYLNTLTRAPPFFIGMIYGYMLHIYRDRKIRISRFSSIALWSLCFIMMAFCTLSIHTVMQPDHSAQVFDNFLNAYMRAMWAAALGWLIFACANGYGGVINWFLSLSLWKLPARLSYAMYLVHVSLIFVSNGTWTKTKHFSTGEALHRFAADLTLTFVAAFLLCVAVDAPCSTLQKLLLAGSKKRPEKPKPTANGAVIETDKYIKTSL